MGNSCECTTMSSASTHYNNPTEIQYDNNLSQNNKNRNHHQIHEEKPQTNIPRNNDRNHHLLNTSQQNVKSINDKNDSQNENESYVEQYRINTTTDHKRDEENTNQIQSTVNVHENQNGCYSHKNHEEQQQQQTSHLKKKRSRLRQQMIDNQNRVLEQENRHLEVIRKQKQQKQQKRSNRLPFSQTKNNQTHNCHSYDNSSQNNQVKPRQKGINDQQLSIQIQEEDQAQSKNQKENKNVKFASDSKQKEHQEIVKQSMKIILESEQQIIEGNGKESLLLMGQQQSKMNSKAHSKAINSSTKNHQNQLLTPLALKDSTQKNSATPPQYIIEKGLTLRQEYQLKKIISNIQQTVLESTSDMGEIIGKKQLQSSSALSSQNSPHLSFGALQIQTSTNKDKFQPLKNLDLRKQFYRVKLNDQTVKFYRGSVSSTVLENSQSSQNFPLKQLEGYGQQYTLNNQYYIGPYHNNLFDGDNGFYLHSDKDFYFGEWHQNQAHGKGIYQYYDGMRYSGSWKCDQQHGEGTEYWEDGAVFEGQFYEGHKIYGLFQWPNNSSYKGQFKEGKLQGKGFYQYDDGRWYRGEWKNNMMDGFGEFHWNNGQSFQGVYKNDKKNGKGKLQLQDGTLIEGTWIDGKIHNRGKVTMKDGSVKIVEWNMGVEVKQKKQ